jgi:hypothetical protein
MVIVEGVEDLQEIRSDDPKDVPHVLSLQQFDQDPAARHIAHGSPPCLAGLKFPGEMSASDPTAAYRQPP